MKRKMNWKIKVTTYFAFFILLLFTARINAGEEKKAIPTPEEIEQKVITWMEAGKIPGLTLVIIRPDRPVFIKGYGYADLESKTPVTAETRFELASCSKSFTALAALRLEANGAINLDSPVSDYLPWFYVTHRGERCQVTLRQCLHHTSGIPWNTISLIPPGNDGDALEQTVKNLVGVELNQAPGERYEYATTNYDIVGAVMAKVSGKSYEQYMTDDLLLPLGLSKTTVGVGDKIPLMAAGYKRGFFQLRKYEPPVFRGNNPAGYIVSNGSDMARWLEIQLGLTATPFNPLIQASHQPDLTVRPGPNLASYAMGWFVNPYLDNEISHSGMNPNFSSHIIFRPQEKIGTAVLVNSNSPFTTFIAESVMRLLTGRELREGYPSTDKVDAFCSILSFVLVLYLLLVVLFMILRVVGVFRGKNRYEAFSWKKGLRLFIAVSAGLPFLYGLYLIPRAIAHMSWDAIQVWAPVSFKVSVLLLLASLGFNYLRLTLSLVFPSNSKYWNEIPHITIMSILSGLAGTGILFLITTSFFSSITIGYLLYYFGLVYLLNVGGRKIAQTKLINISNNLSLDLRVDLINKLFATKYQQFEKIHDGRIFTTLNDDTAVLAGSAGLLINFFTSLITLLSGFIYMTTISPLSTLVVIGVTIGLVFYYRIVARQSRVFMEAARDSQNQYMSLLNGTTRGYKELSIHRRKKFEFKHDLVECSRINSTRSIMAAVKFLNANLIGDSFALIILGVLSIVISRVVTGVSIITLISFVMVILYLLGPLRIILNVIPMLTRLRVSWDRIKEFVRHLDISGSQESVREFIKNLDIPKAEEKIDLNRLSRVPADVENLKIQGLVFEYKNEEGEKGFSTGPVDFELARGEAVFIVGGNGSGKTTVAKLITGLYLFDNGSIKINDVDVSIEQLGEYYSTIYSDYHLFRKLYGVDLDNKETLIQKYLTMLDLHEKVQLNGNEYSTLDLSGGQRKRLALFQCLVEDRPIFLFDELAADQDPEFRRFFYRELLPQIKQSGKLVIAITHDDHYFDAADRVIKMDMGEIDMISSGEDFGSKLSLTGVNPGT